MSDIVLIPTYNERENILSTISAVRKHAGSIRILVIDDNSPDGTADLVGELMKSDRNLNILKRQKKEGLGLAYVDALCRIRTMGDIDNVITMDADGSHDPESIPRMLDKAKTVDLVIGSRYVNGGGVDNWAWHRYLLSYFGNLYSRIVLGSGVHDLTAGFICFRRKILGRLEIEGFNASGYAYQIEFKHECLHVGASYVEIPILFKERKIGTSKMSFGIIYGGIITPLRLRAIHRRRGFRDGFGVK